MKYLCLVYADERSCDALPGKLAPARSAVTVRRRDGKVSVTDGPFAETKEPLGGFFLVEARDLNDTIRLASHIPSVRNATIEVRPIAQLAGPADDIARMPSKASGATYLCLVCYAQQQRDALPKAAWDALVADSVAYNETLKDSGHMILAHALAPVQAATTVRVRNGRLSITDGPYAETKEQIGGFMLIAARDPDDAIQVAARVPAARLGSVEVRAVHELVSTH